MSGYDKGYNRKRPYRKHYDPEKQKHVVGEKGQEVVASLPENSPVLQAFREYAAELDIKHDKYERIVKLSRDITIESKRIIFLLHSVDRENKKEKVLQEAETRLTQLMTTHFRTIAKELSGEDAYQFLRAYTAGLQEFVEALTFYHFIKDNDLYPWHYVQKKLIYSTVPEENKPALETEEQNLAEPSKRDEICLIPQSEYILGIADLTGELMRKCINNLGLGYVESCFQTCAFVRDIYTGFLGIGNTGPKECTKKIYTLRQSLTKMENACYTIHVRGSEIPKHMLADVFSGTHDELVHEDDEGFY